MSDLTIFKGAMPSFLKNAELDATTKALMGSGGSSKRISIKGNVFRMMSGSEQVAVSEDRSMNIVVLAAAPHISRSYYEGTYKDGDTAAPSCWSADGVNPDSSIEAPQGSSCAQCPQNIKGSGEGESRACRYSRRLAVLLEGDLEGDIYQLQLPATSLFGKEQDGKMPLEAYVRFLAGHNVPVTAVVTEMRFDINSPTPKLFFKAAKMLNDDQWATCQHRASEKEATEAIRFSFQAKPKGGEKTVALPKSTKTAAAVEDAREVEPTKVSKAKATPAPAKSAEEAIAEWGTDD